MVKELLTERDDIFINKGMRNNERVMFDDFVLARELWEKLKPHVAELAQGSRLPMMLNERFRFYRYEPGQFFDWHADGSFSRPGQRSHLKFMIYLNGDCEGGTTDFYIHDGTFSEEDQPHLTVKPEKGMALVFVHHVLHRGSPVTAGRKYVLRSDVMYG